MSRSNRVLAGVVLLAALAAAPAAAAARGRDRDEARFARAPRTWMVEALEQLWQKVVGVWEATGVSLDPDGNRGQGNAGEPAPQGDSGVSLDPDG